MTGPRRARARVAAVLALAAALLVATVPGCGTPPDGPGDVGSLKLGIVIDRALHKFTRAFRIWVALADKAGVGRVTCDQIPTTYQYGKLAPGCVEADDCATQITWDGSTSEANATLRVLTGKPLIIVAEALAERQGVGTFFIGRGCVDNQTFIDGQTPTVTIDVKASVGARCTTGTCEINLTCQTGPSFSAGYCTRGCQSNNDCPPGSHCINSDAGAPFCARLCESSLANCEVGAVQDCEGRQGPDGCATVCVSPQFNTAGKCTPGS